MRPTDIPLAIALFLALAFVPTLASPDERVAGPYAARVIETLDGDSIRAEIAIWPGQRVRVIVRIRGVDTPEMRARCPSERRRALAARQFLAGRLSQAPVTLGNIGGGIYFGRVLADVRLAGGEDAASLLLDRRFARPYRGGARQAWCIDGSAGQPAKSVPD